VRWIFPLLCLTSFSFSARGQEQEKKLVDRLLRPDMSLVNPAQDKKFIAGGGAPLDKEFAVKSFPTSQAPSKSFAGMKGFFARIFGTKSFARSKATANTNLDAACASSEFSTRESSLVRPAPDSTKRARRRDYTDQRPFLAKGTRQEALSQQEKNRPLTIDEVRELLNRNK